MIGRIIKSNRISYTVPILEKVVFYDIGLMKLRRRKRRGKEFMARLTPIKAIRAKCLDCCCGQIKEVRLCSIKNCALYEYRNGHRPKEEDLSVENTLSEKS